MLQLTCRGNFNQVIPPEHLKVLEKIFNKRTCSDQEIKLIHSITEDSFLREHQYSLREMILQHYPLFELFPELSNHPFLFLLIQPDYLYSGVPSTKTGHLLFFSKSLDKNVFSREKILFSSTTQFSLKEYTKRIFGCTPKSLRKLFNSLQVLFPVFPLSMNYSLQEKDSQVFQLFLQFQSLNYCLYYLNKLNANSQSISQIPQWLKVLPEIVSQPHFIFQHVLGSENYDCAFHRQYLKTTYSFQSLRTHTKFFSKIEYLSDFFTSFHQRSSFLKTSVGLCRKSQSLIQDTYGAIQNLVHRPEQYEKFLKEFKALPFYQKNTIQKFHDEVSKLYTRIYNEDFSLQQEENFPGITNLTRISLPSNLKIVIPQTSHELKEWGKILRNCVGTYDRSILNKNTSVIGIKDGHTIKYCLEIRPVSPNQNQFQAQFNLKEGKLQIEGIDQKWELVQFVGQSNTPAPKDIQELLTNASAFKKFVNTPLPSKDNTEQRKRVRVCIK